MVDHTANKILGMHNPCLEQDALFNILKRYQDIKIFDLLLTECCRNGRILFPYYYRVCLNAKQNELKTANHLGFDTLVIQWNFNDKLERLQRALNYASSFAIAVHISVQQAPSLSDEAFKTLDNLIRTYSVKSLIYCDDESVLDPFKTYENLNYVQKIISCPIEFLSGNANGLATANALAAIRCGVETIHTHVGGSSSFCGAAMEELLLSYSFFFKKECKEQTEFLANDCRRILEFLNIKIPPNKAIIGENIFAHESGIHVDGIMKNPLLYEIIKPEEVGLQRKLIIGKHSGKSAVEAKLFEFGIFVSAAETTKLVLLAKDLAERQKRALNDEQFLQIYHQTRNTAASG